MPQPRELRKSLARTRMMDFVTTVFPGYRVNWHHRLIAEKLEAVQRGEITRLMVSVPPRHGKSELVSRMFPAWALGRNPNEQVIACSYNDLFAKDFNRDVQRYMTGKTYPRIFPGTRLNERNVVAVADRGARRNARQFDIVGERGSYIAAGVGGGITGKGATIGVIDDPIKNHADAYSETVRRAQLNWYTSTFLTRGEGSFSMGGDMRVILCMTRWHEADLAGHLLEQMEDGGDQWDIVNLPAILDCEPTPGDPRKQGEALWPEKYDVAALEKIRKRVGERDWNALYQQRPHDEAGGMFKAHWWQRYDETPRLESVWTSWDMAFKGSNKSDYVVGQVWGRARGCLYLLDQVRGQWDFVRTVLEFRNMAARYPQAMKHLVEDKANGPAVINALRKDIMGIIAVDPQGSKEARAAAVTPIVESENVYIPRKAHWVNGFISECSSFPRGKNDDQVDAMTQAISHGQTNAAATYAAAARAGY